jgi:RecJ-like exonuclease|tara:strand:+ start:1173 stop:1358 length:186 start_codon:yes stop_codon:yes gene_type:complete
MSEELVTCYCCHGSGMIGDDSDHRTCDVCHGTGKITKAKLKEYQDEQNEYYLRLESEDVPF